MLKAQVFIAQFYANDKEALLKVVRSEYELLVDNLAAFYKAKKQWAEAAKMNLVDNAEKNMIFKQYQQLKADWHSQQKQWQSVMLQYA